MLLLLLSPLLGGCITGNLSSTRIHHPPEGLERVNVGDDLARCLEVLGAPLHVREVGAGALLAWGWARDFGWRATVSVPIDRQSVSLTYGRSDIGLDGLVLLFDDEWSLTSVRRGRLADEMRSAQQRASLVE